MNITAVTGLNSTIIKELQSLLPNEKFVRINTRNKKFGDEATYFPIDAHRYIFCAGLLFPKKIYEQTEEEIYESLAVNLITTVKICEEILLTNKDARILILSSESGYKGSYDTTYFLAKAAINKYIECRAISGKQQLLGLAPSIIEDTNMTQSRKDLDAVKHGRLRLPKHRLIYAVEVAKMIKCLLYEVSDYVTNTTILMNGGKFACMR